MKEIFMDPGLWVAGGALAVVGLITHLTRGAGQKAPKKPGQASDYGSHGTSRWATDKEIETAFPTEGPGAILGRLPKGKGKGKTWRPVVFPWSTTTRNRFVLMIGPPGSGKTSRYTLPNLLQAAAIDRQRSIICTDPKGELYRNTAKLFQKAGFKVRVLNLDNQQASDRYNPMDYVSSVEDALRLANTIIANTGGTHAGGDQFWVNSEKSLLACLIWYVKSSPDISPEYQHLYNVLYLGNSFAGDPELMKDIYEQLPQEHGARQLYNVIASLSDKTRDGVFVGFAVRLQLWASPQVVSLTAASDFRIEDLGTEPTVLFMIIPDHDDTFRVISSLFFDQAFQRLIALADASGGRLPVECRLMLEEMANIGKIPNLEKRLATIRSRGIIPEMVLQTIGQLKDIYGDAESTIIGCCDTLLVLAANDQDTADRISKRLGTTTIRTSGQSQTQAERGGSQGMSQSYIQRPLMFPDEVQGQGAGGLHQDTLLVLQRGLPPAKIEKYPVSDSPWFSQIEEADPADYAPPTRGPLKLLSATDLILEPPAEVDPDDDPDGAPDDETAPWIKS